jgi:hypothetical protein
VVQVSLSKLGLKVGQNLFGRKSNRKSNLLGQFERGLTFCVLVESFFGGFPFGALIPPTHFDGYVEVIELN